jgi:hypothetical protein
MKKAVEFLKPLWNIQMIMPMCIILSMEYLFMDNLKWQNKAFIKCLEEDLDDQSILYNVVYCFEFLDQNLMQSCI